MNIRSIFQNKVIIADCVPIGIPELGFAYLNDNGMWNITINSKSTACHNKTITVGQLLEIFEKSSKCFSTMEERFQEELPMMIEEIKKFEMSDLIEFN